MINFIFIRENIYTVTKCVQTHSRLIYYKLGIKLQISKYFQNIQFKETNLAEVDLRLLKSTEMQTKIQTHKQKWHYFIASNCLLKVPENTKLLIKTISK